MLMRTHISPKKRLAFSLKSILMTATIVFFLILHIIGAAFIHRAAVAQASGATVLALSGD